MKFRKSRAILTMAATAAFAGIATATPAAAAWNHTWYSADDNPGATVRVQEYGDVIKLCDSDADGYSAYVEVSYSGRSFSMRVGGNGDCTSSDAQEHNIPENATVDLLIGLMHSDRPGIHFPNWASYKNDH